MNRRFFSERPVSSDSIELAGSEAQHIAKVLRGSPGDVLTIFDGSGCEFSAEITEVGRNAVQLQVLTRQQISREPTCHLTLGVALPKGERQRTLVEKCVELGVATLVPLETSRGVAVPKSLDRLRRGVIEASKQCGRNVLMEITNPTTLQSFVDTANPAAERWLAHPPLADPDLPGAKTTDVGSTANKYTAIGPEGGFTPEEVQHAIKSGWQRMSLGPTLLRVETAAIAVAARLLIESDGHR